ncbi:MAG: response regulator transcription factor [bacterium]|nr:response regulator transcription factor [bacterium]
MRILIVDDDKEIRDFLKTSLQAECYVVDTANDGEEGSYLARTHDYDILIIDNIMPKKNGFEMCQDVRKHGKKMPIIVISVQSGVDDKVNLLNAGADDYLTKPFSYRELQSRIRALMRRPQTLVNPVLKVDDLILDATKQKVRRGAKEVYLTRKEFALTEYLMRNSGAVVSRGMLMEHVWNDAIDPFSNTIEAHILNLRKKIDAISKRKLIHTVPGRGYKIESIGRAVFS